MKLPVPAVDYRDFRLSRLNSPEYRHLWYLLFWPAFLLRYILIENLNPARTYHLIWSPLDDLIPFCEWFLIPYVLWYAAIVGMHVYTMLYDVASFRKYSRFLLVSIGISTAVFLLYPSCQNLRPVELPRDNLLTRIIGLIYAADTNTNVFPSEHAIGAMAVFAAAANTRSLRTPGKLTAIGILAVLICFSTVFLKQHSILDVAAAVPVSMIAYWIVYGRKEKGHG